MIVKVTKGVNRCYVSIIENFTFDGNGYRKHWKDIFNKNIAVISCDVDIEMK